jgi:hypothetical protein
MMTMAEIVPAIFKCREHDKVLTDAVIAMIKATPVATVGAGLRSGDRLVPRRFKVVVHCDAADGHELVFQGTYQPD